MRTHPEYPVLARPVEIVLNEFDDAVFIMNGGRVAF
jgi:hypothetical protein